MPARPAPDHPAPQPPEEPGAPSGIRAYGEVVRSPGMPVWTGVVLCQRLPIAMSPLALVYVGHAATGSYVLGAVLAGVFALAEAVAAGPGGRRFDRRPAGPELRTVLAIQSVALGLLALPLVGTSPLPVPVLVALAAIGGAVASGAHGGLRSLLLRTVPESTHQAALSLEATTTTLLWAVGPAVVAGLAALTSDLVPMVLIAGTSALGAVLAIAVRDQGPAVDESSHTSMGAIIAMIWPALLQEAAVLMCVGAAYTALPPLLAESSTDSDWAGPLLAAFAAAGIVGGLAYGARTWPGAYRTHSAVLVLALTLSMLVAAAPIGLPGLIFFLLLAGLVGTPALTARAAGVQQLLPESRWATGFSALYAAGGVGFGIAGFVTAGLIDTSGARTALAVSALLATTAVIVSALAERRSTT
ncbi:MFS transporter [Nocardioides plantarum]|uniref:Major facilitator superfamily (MFS) profile domain-containing protein n=2 Tax=Nocardioides plantarum TaxID=29299 RepID=A0ABV5KAP0_9ACTN|nr:MFS transporter [Nocardioides plantarum]